MGSDPKASNSEDPPTAELTSAVNHAYLSISGTGFRLLRGLLLAFVLLTAALPAGVCVCEVLHLHHHDQTNTPDDSDDCPCHCKLHPRVTTAPTPLAVEGDSGLSLFVPAADLALVPQSVNSSAFRSESPPHGASHPLYLSVGRLLI